MEILIKSKQIFEDHVDSVEEKYEAELNLTNDGFYLKYNNCTIEFLNNILKVKNENSDLIIEEGKSNFSEFKTPYGNFEIQITGEKIFWESSPFSLEISYFIKLGSAQEYKNELQIKVI